MALCKRCGQQTEAGAEFCDACGGRPGPDAYAVAAGYQTASTAPAASAPPADDSGQAGSGYPASGCYRANGGELAERYRYEPSRTAPWQFSYEQGAAIAAGSRFRDPLTARSFPDPVPPPSPASRVPEFPAETSHAGLGDSRRPADPQSGLPVSNGGDQSGQAQGNRFAPVAPEAAGPTASPAGQSVTATARTGDTAGPDRQTAPGHGRDSTTDNVDHIPAAALTGRSGPPAAPSDGRVIPPGPNGAAAPRPRPGLHRAAAPGPRPGPEGAAASGPPPASTGAGGPAGSPAEPRRAPRSGRWISLTAAAGVLVIATVVVALTFGRTGTAGSKPAAPGSRRLASPASTARGPASTAPAGGQQLVTVTQTAARSPHAVAAVSFLTSYFSAINAHDYAAYQRLSGASGRGGLSALAFTAGYGSTRDSAIVLHGVTVTGPGEIAALVSFTSHQQPASSPTDSACTTWHIALYLLKQDHHYLLQPPPRGYQASAAACP